jgi:hypothetical protein
MRTKNPQPSKLSCGGMGTENLQPLKKARIEVIIVDGDDVGDDEDNNMLCPAGDDEFMNRLFYHLKQVCGRDFFFDGADNLRAIQRNYDRLKRRAEGLERADATPIIEYQSAYLIKKEWRSFPGNSLFLFTSLTHSFFCR